jgi:hypothetical protein
LLEGLETSRCRSTPQYEIKTNIRIRVVFLLYAFWYNSRVGSKMQEELTMVRHVVCQKFADKTDAGEAARQLRALVGQVPTLRSMEVGVRT